jgi:hypothetical protein
MANHQDPHPLAAEGGAAPQAAIEGDGLDQLFDLMCVIEQLCPEWPPREITKDGDYWLL